MGRHYNFLLHHIGKGQHHLTRVVFKYYLNKFPIGQMMAHFVSCDNSTHFTKKRIASLFTHLSHPFMRNIGGQLLKRGVYKVFIRISIRSYIKTIGNKMLGGYFHFPHIYPSGQIKVFVKHISMSIFLGGPMTHPFGPTILVFTMLIYSFYVH